MGTKILCLFMLMICLIGCRTIRDDSNFDIEDFDRRLREIESLYKDKDESTFIITPDDPMKRYIEDLLKDPCEVPSGDELEGELV